MRKLYTLAFASLITVSATQAQITIADTDMPVVNDTFRLSTTTDHWSIDPSLTGTSYNWDFSFLTPEAQNLDTCLDVSTLPVAYQFYFNNVFLYPSWKANFATPGQEFDLAGMFTMTDVYDFFKVGSTRYQNVGFGANINGIPASVRKNPIEIMYPLPMTYGDSFDNYSKFEVEVPTLGAYKQKKYKHAEVDGWGNITLPIGTFPAVRVKFNVNITDSIYVETFGFAFENPRPTETHYHWLAQGKDVPLLQIVTDSTTGTITSIAYQDNFVPVGIQETVKPVIVNVYPNPVNHSFTVNAAEPLQAIALYDLFGRKVLSVNATGLSQTVTIPSALANGTYILECTSHNGRERQKLVVQR